MRRILPAILVLLLVAGCSKPPATQPRLPEPAQPAVPAPATPETGPSTPPSATPAAPGADSITIELPVPVSLPESVERVELAPGQSIQAPGLYYLDVATGQLEGWSIPPTAGNAFRSIWSAPDHRWLIYQVEKEGYLIRRADGAAFRFNAELFSVSTGPDRFLLSPLARPEGKVPAYAVLDQELKQIATFTLPGAPRHEQFLFSPDGTRLIAAPQGGADISLVDVASGKVSSLTPSPDGWVTLTDLPQLGGFGVQTDASFRWFDWEGQVLGEESGTRQRRST